MSSGLYICVNTEVYTHSYTQLRKLNHFLNYILISPYQKPVTNISEEQLFPGMAREAEVCTLPCVISQFVKLVFLRCPTLGDSILSTDEGQDDRQGTDWQRSNFLLKVKEYSAKLSEYTETQAEQNCHTNQDLHRTSGLEMGTSICLKPDTKASTNLPSDHLVGAQDHQAENLWHLSSCLPINPAPHGPACPLLQMKFPEASPTGFLATPPLPTASTSLSAPCLRKASLNSAVASLALL